MVTIQNLQYAPKTAGDAPLDARSAFDQVKVTPKTTLWQGQTSFDEEDTQFFYVATGLPMGVSYCPKRCQGQLADILRHLAAFLSQIKLYIDDILPIIDMRQKTMGDIAIIFDSILVILHKLGLQINQKTPPILTSTPEYLGYIMDFETGTFYPQPKHLFKLGTLLFQTVNPETPTTFHTLLQMKGILNFALKQKGVRLCQFMDEYIRQQFHAHKKGIEEILGNKIPISPKYIKFLEELNSFLANPVNLEFKQQGFSKGAETKILIATDASPERKGGFCLINGTAIPHHPMFSQITMSEAFCIHTPILFSWSSTDIERKALHTFLTKYLDPFLYLKSPKGKTEIICLTDSQPLTYQLLHRSNKNPMTCTEISEIWNILHKYSDSPKIFWHPRDSQLGKQADSSSREHQHTLPDPQVRQCINHFQLHDLIPYMDAVTWGKIAIFSTHLPQPPTHTSCIFHPLKLHRPS